MQSHFKGFIMRKKEELNKLYRDCLKFWGLRAQARMTQEECSELILAVSHFLRGRKDSDLDVIEELADVYLMIHQMMYHFGKERVMDVVDFKSNRVKDKLNVYKGKSNED